MKKLYLFAALAAMLAACSENDLSQSPKTQENNEQAVLFGAYVNRGTTRAGQQATMTTTLLRTSTSDAAVSNGFGVLGYYTNDELYSQNAKPEFFYNQKVYYDGSWKYEPIKYWPNEFGADAESQAEDKLTFFAYAPYVPVNISTGIAQQSGSPLDDLETGIISLTRNTALGDPYVKYCVSFDPEKCVDLCFGVAKEDFTSSVDGNKNSVEAGMPYIDVKKPKLSDRIFFDFKHALAQLNVQIDADVDEMIHGTTNPLAAKTKIYVREVTFEGFADKGMLNLNSEAKTDDYTPKWVDLSGINEIKTGKVTIYDGRRNGREGQVNAEAPNEKPQNLNPKIISDAGNTTPGVPATTLVNLFEGENESASVLVIPTEEPLSVTIVYDVETEDNNLATFLSDGKKHGSTVENRITKAITLNGNPLKLAAGKSYVVNLHLGMTSVKFDASVTDWQTITPAGNADLPVNAPSASAVAGTTPTPVEITIPAGSSEGTFRVTGLNPEATVTITPSDGVTVTGAPYTTDKDGTVTISYTVSANNTIINKPKTLTVATSGVSGVLSITQLAHALDLDAPTITDAATDGKTIQLTSAFASMEYAAGYWTSPTTYTIVKKDRTGAETSLVEKTGEGDPGANQYKVSEETGGTAGNLTLGTAVAAGDVYTITVNPGDGRAAAETVTLRVGGIAFVPNAYTIEYGTRGFNPTYTVYGKTPTNPEYEVTVPSPADYVTVGSSDGVITTTKVGTATIKCSVDQDDEEPYKSTEKSKEATYTLTVKKANGTLSYAIDDKTKASVAANNVVTCGTPSTDLIIATAELKNSRGDRLPAADDARVTYEIISVNGDDASTTFTIDTATGKLKVGATALTYNTTYTIRIKASITDDTNVTYSTNSQTAEFTVTTIPAP